MMKRIIPWFVFWFVTSFTLLTVTAWAQAQDGPPGPGGADRPHHPPPPEAIAACKGKANGAACNFIGRQGEPRTGTCFTPPPRPPAPPPGQPGATTPPGKFGDQAAKPMACRPARPAPH